MLFLHNTSHVDGEPYPNLLKEKGFGGFPSLCFMDADGNVLTKPARSVKAFVETHAAAKTLTDLRAKGDRLTPAEAKQLFLAELALDLIPAAEIQARSDRHADLSVTEKSLVAQKLVDAEVSAILSKGRESGPEKVGDALAALAKADRLPSEATRGRFWAQVLGAASRQKDADLAQKAYDALLTSYAAESGDAFERAKRAWQKLVEDAKAK